MFAVADGVVGIGQKRGDAERMISRLAALVVVGPLCSAGIAAAQESDAPRPGVVEVRQMMASVESGAAEQERSAAPLHAR